MTALDTKIPPPVIGLATAALMWWAARLPGRIELAVAVRAAVAIALLCIGVAIAVAGAIAFHRARTTVNPLKPDQASALVTSGTYRVTRNPMYLGMLVVLVGWAAFLASLPALLCTALFVLYITRFQIVPEERVLQRLFGKDFIVYCQRVRRWI